MSDKPEYIPTSELLARSDAARARYEVYLSEATEKYKAQFPGSPLPDNTMDSHNSISEKYADVAGDKTLVGRLENESPGAILRDVREQQRQEATKAAQDFWAQAVTVGQQMRRSEQAAQKAEDKPRQTQRA